MKEAILATFGFYRSATCSERRAISQAAIAVHLPPGAVFYREGEEIGQFALVGQGDLRVFRTASNGRELTLYHVGSAQPCLVNLLCLVLGRRAMASAVAEESTDAVLVPADVFRKLLTTSGALQHLVFEAMATRVVDMLTLVEEITVAKMDVRLASWLLRRFAARRPGDPIVATHDEIAVELGTVREVVSRVLKEFERKGAVRLSRGRVALADERMLASLTAGAEISAIGPD